MLSLTTVAEISHPVLGAWPLRSHRPSPFVPPVLASCFPRLSSVEACLLGM